MSKLDLERCSEEAAKIAAGFERVAASYVAAGSTPLAVAIAMTSQGAGQMAQLATASDAGETLRLIAAKVETGIPGTVSIKGERPADHAEMLDITRNAINVITTEFATVARECVALIDAGDIKAAAAKLADIAGKLSISPTNH